MRAKSKRFWKYRILIIRIKTKIGKLFLLNTSQNKDYGQNPRQHKIPGKWTAEVNSRIRPLARLSSDPVPGKFWPMVRDLCDQLAGIDKDDMLPLVLSVSTFNGIPYTLVKRKSMNHNLLIEYPYWTLFEKGKYFISVNGPWIFWISENDPYWNSLLSKDAVLK